MKDLLVGAIKAQQPILSELSEEKKALAYGRAAKVIVDGPGGGEFDLWFSSEGLNWKPDDVPLRNTIFLEEWVFLDLVTPDLALEDIVSLVKEGRIQEIYGYRPRLDPRAARANGLILIAGDASLYDAEELAVTWDMVVRKVLFPIVVRGLARLVKRGAG